MTRFSCQNGLDIKLEFHGLEDRLCLDVESAAYRVIQEALTNVARHSKTDKATVTMCVSDETLRVTIDDGGIGFDLDSSGTSGVALRGMRERVELLGGALHFKSSPGKGTRLSLELSPQQQSERSP